MHSARYNCTLNVEFARCGAASHVPKADRRRTAGNQYSGTAHGGYAQGTQDLKITRSCTYRARTVVTSLVVKGWSSSSCTTFSPRKRWYGHFRPLFHDTTEIIHVCIVFLEFQLKFREIIFIWACTVEMFSAQDLLSRSVTSHFHKLATS